MAESTFTLALSKVLPVLVYPVGLVLVLLVIALTAAHRGRQRAAVWATRAAVVWLWLTSTPIFADKALSSLEGQYPPVAVETLGPADVAIVLGGAIGLPIPPRLTSDLSPASDRVLHAARLYRQGKVRRVLVTGGNVAWAPQSKPEAEVIRDLLMEWGVPDSAIEFAGASRNTYENALEIKAISARRPFASGYLVTSAAHMPRALAVFRKAGLPVTPATTDVEVVAEARTILSVLPSAAALERTTTATKEWIGYFAYRLRGYL